MRAMLLTSRRYCERLGKLLEGGLLVAYLRSLGPNSLTSIRDEWMKWICSNGPVMKVMMMLRTRVFYFRCIKYRGGDC